MPTFNKMNITHALKKKRKKIELRPRILWQRDFACFENPGLPEMAHRAPGIKRS